MIFGVGGSNGATSGSVKSKMPSDGHLGMTALSRVTLASAGLSCYYCGRHGIGPLRDAGCVQTVDGRYVGFTLMWEWSICGFRAGEAWAAQRAGFVRGTKGAITSKIKHAIKLKTSPA